MHLEITLYKHYLFYYNILYTFIQESLKMGFFGRNFKGGDCCGMMTPL
jgi:hypothetical protein